MSRLYVLTTELVLNFLKHTRVAVGVAAVGAQRLALRRVHRDRRAVHAREPVSQRIILKFEFNDQV